GFVALKWIIWRQSREYSRTYAPFIFPTRQRIQGLQILLMSGVTVTSASQILESFWRIWSQKKKKKKPFSDFTARGPGMNNYRDGYTV
ncbi:MAG: hypothetical protein MI923_27340, partial [Phycisphaerales bacterium]|nr:hypothetical protein [Phycisphaerales bacterium]